VLLLALALLVAPRPTIVQKPIPFGPARRAETAAYAERHYGVNTWRLTTPRVIVEHYTATTSFSATWNTFAADTPDPELGERPGTCAHFVVDRDGTIYQLVQRLLLPPSRPLCDDTGASLPHLPRCDARLAAAAPAAPRTARPLGRRRRVASRTWKPSAARR
jgi:beta-N-acetylhexosaminidase